MSFSSSSSVAPPAAAPPPPKSRSSSRGGISVSSPNLSDVTMSDAEFAFMDPNYIHDTDDNDDDDNDDNDNNATNDEESGSLLEYSDTSIEYGSRGGGGGGGTETNTNANAKTSANAAAAFTAAAAAATKIPSRSRFRKESDSHSTRVVQFNVPDHDDKKEQHLVQQQHQLQQASSLAVASLSPREREQQKLLHQQQKVQLQMQIHSHRHAVRNHPKQQQQQQTASSPSSHCHDAREPPARYTHPLQQEQYQHHYQNQHHQDHQHNKFLGKETSASGSRKHKPRNATATSSATATTAHPLPDAPAEEMSPFKQAENWMAKLAYSFRSPKTEQRKRSRSHRVKGSSAGSGPVATASSSRRRSKAERGNSGGDGDHSGSLEEYQHVSHTRDELTTGIIMASTISKEQQQHQQHHHHQKSKERGRQVHGEMTPLLSTATATPVSASASATSSTASAKECSRTAHKPIADVDLDVAAGLVDHNFVVVAAAFLQDYEANRPPALSSELSGITETQLLLHSVKFSAPFSLLLTVGTIALFASSGLESFADDIQSRIILTALNLFSLTVFGVDMWIRNEFRSNHYHYSHRHPNRPTGRGRSSRSERLIKPIILFSVVLALENLARLLITQRDSLVLFSSFFKPMVLFYASSQARDALEALRRIIRVVVRVLVIELLLILMFAAVACRLFQDYDRFQDLSTAWLSLFELATTVVNPSIWMPMYESSKFSAFFFIFFIVTAVFYLHSLVLSVVFSSYIQAAGEIHERTVVDREDAIQLAYLALQQQQQQKTKGQPVQEDKLNVVDISLVGETLRLVRPHYNAMKINALLEIVDPTKQKFVNYPTFRTKIRQALNASIRTPRNASTFAMCIELVAVAVAVVNFCYVILLSSAYDHEWFNSAQERVGVVITLVSGFELAIRFNPLRIPNFTPLTRLNYTFDGLALTAALASSIGIVKYVAGWPMSLEYILMGRAFDMFRIMRFFQVFRDVVRRSSDVLPALVGPIVLVLTTLHIFVYMGMAIWGGAVHVGSHQGEITFLYDLNNFNSYQEGVVTMFQVLVVNDWHAIAEVFLYADRCSSPYIVYPFFILGNLIGVSIMLNVLTAFFVESFVTKLRDSGAVATDATTTVQKDRDFNILTAENTSVRRVSASSNILATKTKAKVKEQPSDDGSDHDDDADSEASSENELFQFDVYEREGFDKIMQTVAGAPQSGGDFARNMCSYLEIFERLSPGRETVGYLICDQQTLDRFGNRRFQTKAIGFLDENQLHSVVSDMHSELLALSSRVSFDGRSLIRTFPREHDPNKTLEISASILRRHPAVSLFVSRVALEQGQKSVDQALSV